jgi:putative glutathione S-transferase
LPRCARQWPTLDEIEARLGRQRYLVGHQITEADWRLFPTLTRFDVAYFSLFKCNRNRIADFPNLLNYVRELYTVPGVAETVKPRYYVMGYYPIKHVNPTGIIPKGTPVDFKKPHDRARFCGVSGGEQVCVSDDGAPDCSTTRSAEEKSATAGAKLLRDMW